MSQHSSSNISDSNSSESSSFTIHSNRNYVYPNECFDHNNSCILNFNNGRNIRRGNCLEHLQKQCIVFSGIDIVSGKLLYITEWTIKYSQIESKCNTKCLLFKNYNFNDNKVELFISGIQEHIKKLTEIRHTNLVSYECVSFLKNEQKKELIIYLAQDFVLGNTLFNITNSIGWCDEGIQTVAKAILETFIFLNNIGLNHGHLNDKTVFIDRLGQVKCKDFFLVQHLLEWVTNSRSKDINDLLALANLLESLSPTLSNNAKNFIEKCKSEKTLLAFELTDHIFLQSPTNATASTSQSWLKEKFEILNFPLGRGAFGYVFKAQNKLDRREYAIKLIRLPAGKERLYEKMEREVKLLSKLNHDNVVRYFSSWIENVSADELEEIDEAIEKTYTNESSTSTYSFSKINSENCAPSSSMLSSTKTYSNQSASDSIEFLNSTQNEMKTRNGMRRYTKFEQKFCQIMYIQMELCEKSTLRQLIEDNLLLKYFFNKTGRFWRVFCEILKGLHYIHRESIIHRDLKPDNIFLDSRDKIKIGDFGLATTTTCSDSNYTMINSESVIGTGEVGTSLYVAPELIGKASESHYNEKVDMYSVGIILFEMSNSKFSTAMERIETISALRTKDIILPAKMIESSAYDINVEIIRQLLQHNPAKRCTSPILLHSMREKIKRSCKGIKDLKKLNKKYNF